MKTPRLEYRNSYEVFVLFAALNALGYDDESRISGMSLLRRRTRGSLRRHVRSQKYPQLKRFFHAHSPWHLLIFTLRGSSIPALRSFSKEPAVRALWREARTRQEAELGKISTLFARETVRLIRLVGKPVRPIDRIVLIPNLLDAYWRGYCLRVRRVCYIVVGPGAEKNGGELIRHELLHLLAPNIHLPLPAHSPKIRARLSRQGYSNQSIINREYVVRGLNLLYESEFLSKNIRASVVRERRNFPYIRKVIKSLKTKMGLAFSKS